MKILKLHFSTTALASNVRDFVELAGFKTRALSEGFEFLILERDNPDWDLSLSVIRLLKATLQATYGESRMEVSSE